MEEIKNMTLFEWIEDKINKKEEVSIDDVRKEIGERSLLNTDLIYIYI